MKKRVRKALLLVNTFGAVGYLAMALAWLLFACVVLFLFMQSSVVTVPISSSAQEVVSSGGGDSLTLRIVAYAITVIMAAVTLFILFLLPYLIGKWGSRMMRHIMKWCRVEATRRNLFLTKGLVLIVPLIGFIILNFIYVPADMTIPTAHISTVFLALLSLACFLLQLVSARSLHIDIKHMW
jgi:hypothetical protein